MKRRGEQSHRRFVFVVGSVEDFGVGSGRLH